ncbi:MAG: hypothetical protein K8F92_07710 [Hyphomicrobium sp.]|nr:hypothetical protein [Hyphomicrobium sp.]MBZ0209525.1 hypothetical protein [Hyphomicrobium sp.]
MAKKTSLDDIAGDGKMLAEHGKEIRDLIRERRPRREAHGNKGRHCEST